MVFRTTKKKILFWVSGMFNQQTFNVHNYFVENCYFLLCTWKVFLGVLSGGFTSINFVRIETNFCLVWKFFTFLKPYKLRFCLFKTTQITILPFKSLQIPLKRKMSVFMLRNLWIKLRKRKRSKFSRLINGGRTFLIGNWPKFH